MRPYLKLVDFCTPPWSAKDPQKVPKLVEVGQSFVIFYVTFIYFTSNCVLHRSILSDENYGIIQSFLHMSILRTDDNHGILQLFIQLAILIMYENYGIIQSFSPSVHSEGR